MNLKSSFFSLSCGHPTFFSFSFSNSYLHFTPERYVIIYSKNRLHSFSPVEAQGNLFFLRPENEAGICYFTSSPPPQIPA